MATPANAPTKRTPKKAAPRNLTAVNGKAPAKPGEPKFNWRGEGLYPTSVELFKYTSEDGFVVCLPKYEDPGEGEVFGLMLMNKSETDLLIYIMRQHITNNAEDGERALVVTFEALKAMKRPGVIEALLEAWPKASGKELGK